MADGFPALPRELAHDQARIGDHLLRTVQPLGPSAGLAVPWLQGTPALMRALAEARCEGQVVIGLEAITSQLDREAHGLSIADDRAGMRRDRRVSRLLVLAGDGAARFYRDAERLAVRHADRLLVCVVDVPAPVLGDGVVGRASGVKAVLVTHKRAVAAVLRAMVPADY